MTYQDTKCHCRLGCSSTQKLTGDTEISITLTRRIGQAFGEKIIAVIESFWFDYIFILHILYNTEIHSSLRHDMPQRRGGDEDTFCIHKSLIFQIQTE